MLPSPCAWLGLGATDPDGIGCIEVDAGFVAGVR
jgi:hypothetical protein